MADKARWTILTYIAAHNNLAEFGERSLDQILGVGSTSAVIQGMLFDGPQGAARYIAGDPGLVLCQEPLQTFDSGDPARLVETARWLFARYPAEQYGLVLWSHGSGWAPPEIEAVARQARGGRALDLSEATVRSGMPGSVALFRTTLAEMLTPDNPAERAILFDDGTKHALDTLQLGQVAREIAVSIGQKLDLLGMDACLMAAVEVAYQLRDSVACMVASEELVPGLSWPYALIFKQLCSQPELPARDLADLVVREYVDYYTQHPPGLGGGDVTKIALDLTRIEPFVTSMKQLASALITNMPQAIACLAQAQQEIYQIETNVGWRTTSKFNYHLWDIVSVAAHLAVHCDQQEVRQAAEQVVQTFRQSRMVIRSGHLGSWFDAIGGLSVYWIAPKKGQPRQISRYYPQVDFARDTGWHGMLEAYCYPDMD